MSQEDTSQDRVPIFSRNIWVFIFAAALFSLGMVEITSAETGIYDHIRNICIEDSPNFETEVPLIEPQSPGPPISLGCKLRDCGPLANKRGDIEPHPINFRVRLDGDEATDSVLIEFSNLPGESFREIKIKEGPGSIGVTQGSIRVPREERVIVEVPPTIVRDGTHLSPDPKINATLFLNRDFLLRTRTKGQADPRKSQYWTATLTIEQLKGPVIVNEFKALYILKWCVAPKPSNEPNPQPIAPIIEPVSPDQNQADQIILIGIQDNLRRLALVNGHRQSGCIKDAPQWGTATISVEGMLDTLPDCPSNEIVLFSPDRAMHVAKPDPDWTNKSDVVKISPPQGKAQVPVTFWILSKPEGKDIVQLKSEIKKELQLANQLFGPDNLCGIEFTAAEESYHDKTAEAKENGLSGFNFCKDGNTTTDNQKFDQTGWKDPGSVNVYYISDVQSDKGSHCGPIFISPRRTPETLAHELGHALGLNDAQDEAWDPAVRHLLSRENLMLSGATGRTVVSQGQCYRCNMNETSAIRLPGLKQPTNMKARDCTGRTGPNDDCVDIFLDVKPPQQD